MNHEELMKAALQHLNDLNFVGTIAEYAGHSNYNATLKITEGDPTELIYYFMTAGIPYDNAPEPNSYLMKLTEENVNNLPVPAIKAKQDEDKEDFRYIYNMAKYQLEKLGFEVSIQSNEGGAAGTLILLKGDPAELDKFIKRPFLSRATPVIGQDIPPSWYVTISRPGMDDLMKRINELNIRKEIVKYFQQLGYEVILDDYLSTEATSNAVLTVKKAEAKELTDILNLVFEEHSDLVIDENGISCYVTIDAKTMDQLYAMTKAKGLGPKLLITPIITLREVIKSGKPIYFSDSTPWWTNDPEDLRVVQRYLGDAAAEIPLDPYKHKVAVSEDPKDFFREALANRDQYGEGELRTLMAAHHKNSFPAGLKHGEATDYLVAGTSFKQYDEAIKGIDIDLLGGDISEIVKLLN